MCFDGTHVIVEFMETLAAREFRNGGMGEVVELTDYDGPPSVAKFVKPEYAHSGPLRRRFENECDVSLTLSGEPGFPIVREVQRGVQLSIDSIKGCSGPRGEVADTLLIMENCGPWTLRDRLNARGSMNSEETAKTATQLALGLYKMHSLGMIHRDFKHDNIAFDKNGWGRARILDFGLAGNQRRPTVEAQGALVGSPSYMAPEAYFEVRGKTQSDLFSLGTVLLECLTAQRFFRVDGYNKWISEYGNIPYMKDYLMSSRQMESYLGHRVPADKKAEIRKILSFNPEETYDLWLNGSPEMLLELLQGRLNLALEKLAPFIRKDDYEEMKYYMTLNTGDQDRGMGSAKLKKLIEDGLKDLNCDDELKAILAQLLELDHAKRPKNGYVLARDLAMIAVKYDPYFRLMEPFYTLIGRATSISKKVEPEIEISKPPEVAPVEEEKVEPKLLMERVQLVGMGFLKRLLGRVFAGEPVV